MNVFKCTVGAYLQLSANKEVLTKKEQKKVFFFLTSGYQHTERKKEREEREEKKKMESASKTHNKSGLSTLSLLQKEDAVIMEWATSASLGNSKKWRMDTRLLLSKSLAGMLLEELKPLKNRESKLISHLCGTRNCCNSEHIVIEPKFVNDERTHCHFCLRSIFEKNGRKGVKQFLAIGGCPHNPQCSLA